MPKITFSLQVNIISASELLIGSLKTEALNSVPFKCLISNYLLKCFPHVGAMRAYEHTAPSLWEAVLTVKLSSLPLFASHFFFSSNRSEVLRHTK